MGVVSSSGVVGIVYMASMHYSIIMPVISIHPKISCRVKESEYFGSLTWKRGNPDLALATGFPRHALLKVGDIIETNGYSDIFPPDIPIGYVYKVVNSEDGMSYSLKIKLYTDFKNLREVSILTDYQAPERITLEEKADSLNIDKEDTESPVGESKKTQAARQAEEEKLLEEARKAIAARKAEEARKENKQQGEGERTEDGDKTEYTNTTTP